MIIWRWSLGEATVRARVCVCVYVCARSLFKSLLSDGRMLLQMGNALLEACQSSTFYKRQKIAASDPGVQQEEA